MAGTTIFDNATILTMVPGRAPARAIAFEEGRIVAVGNSSEVRNAGGPGAEVIDLEGLAVTPGFIDAHQHFSSSAIELDCTDCSAGSAPTIERLQENLRQAARGLAENSWLIGTGYDELALAERRHPLRGDLDDACPERPVLLCHYSGHEAVANSKALQLGRIDRHTPDPVAGIIMRGRGREPNGRLIETAFSRLHMLAESSLAENAPDSIDDRISRYQNALFAAGITRVCDATVSPRDERIFEHWAQSGRLRMPVVTMAASREGLLCPPWDRLNGCGPRTGDGTEGLRTGPLKLFFDGANRCAFRMSIGQTVSVTIRTITRSLRTGSAGLLHNAKDVGMRLTRNLHVRTGVQFFTLEEGRRIVEQACERGFAIAIHAIGNSAIDQAIDAIGRVRAIHTDCPPPRIEHATFITRRAARRAADLGIAVVAQPAFIDLPVLHEMPLPSGIRLLAHRTLIDSGVKLAGSSDAPVASFDPLTAMRAAISRRSRSGKQLGPEEAIRPDEALALYTREAAYVLGSLDVAGTLEPGKRADLVVLSENPISTPAALARTRVECTVLAGEPVYTAGTDQD